MELLQNHQTNPTKSAPPRGNEQAFPAAQDSGPGEAIGRSTTAVQAEAAETSPRDLADATHAGQAGSLARSRAERSSHSLAKAIMARATIGFGLSLCLATVLTLLNPATGRITTAFLPIVFGIPLVISGVISLNPHRRTTWVRFASLIALFGGLGCALRVSQVSWERLTGQTDVYQPLPVAIAATLAAALLVYAMIATLALQKRG